MPCRTVSCSALLTCMYSLMYACTCAHTCTSHTRHTHVTHTSHTHTHTHTRARARTHNTHTHTHTHTHTQCRQYVYLRTCCVAIMSEFVDGMLVSWQVCDDSNISIITFSTDLWNVSWYSNHIWYMISTNNGRKKGLYVSKCNTIKQCCSIVLLKWH